MTTVADPSLAPSPGPARPGPGPGLRCCEFDLTGDTVRSVLPPTPAQRSARVLIRGAGEPLGYVTVAEITGPCESSFGAPIRSWSTRFQPEIIDPAGDRRPGLLHPYSAGIFGTGADVAFEREFLIGADGFNELLGTGTRTRSGEDLDIFGDRPAGAGR